MNCSWLCNLFASSTLNHRDTTTRLKAEQGNAEAQFMLGLGYASGDATTQDYELAAEWYLKAAEQNHPLAQMNLGIMHSTGQGMVRNNSEARVWFGRAAAQGDAGGQHNLGLKLYRASLDETAGTAKESRIEAYKWLQLAAAQHYHGSGNACDQVAVHMAHEDVVEGNNRIARFVCVKPGAN